MKKRFITRKRKRFRVLKIVLFLAFFIGSLIITFHLLNKSNISIDDKRLVEVLLQYSDSSEDKGIIKRVKKMFSTPVLFLDNNYFKVEKVFNHEQKNFEKFCEMNESFRKESTNALAYSGMLIPVIVSLSYFNYALSACVGGIFVIKGIMDLGRHILCM